MKTLTGPLIVLVVVSAAESQSMAAFNQATCLSGAWDTAVPTNIGVEEYVKQSTLPQGGPTDNTLYNHNTDTYSTTILTNNNVQLLQPYYGHFVTELNYDILTITPTSGPAVSYHGALNGGSGAVNSGHTWNIGGPFFGKATYRWQADSSIANDTPPAFTQVTPRCKAAQSTTATNATGLLLSTRYEILLIKTGDVFYAQFAQPANKAIVLSMDALNSTAGGDSTTC